MYEESETPSARPPSHPDVTSSHIETPPDVTSSHVTTPPDVTHSHIATPSEGTPSHLATPLYVPPSHIATPKHVTPAHIATPPEGTSSHLVTFPDVTSSHRATPTEVTPSHIATPPDVTSLHQTTPADVTSLHRTTPPDIVMSLVDPTPPPIVTPPTRSPTLDGGGASNDASRGGLVLQDYISESDLEKSVAGTAVYKEQAVLMEEVPIELEALVPLKSFFLHKDESRRRTVFELRLIDGPLVLSAIDTNPCCFCSGNCQNKPSSTRFLFDASNPVIQMLEEVHGCCRHRGVEICAPPYKYIGHVINTSTWVSFDLTVMGPHEEPLYFIRAKRQCSWGAGKDYAIFSYAKRTEIGNIYRRTDFGYRTGYTVYFPEYIPVKEKALLISATFFLDEVVGQGDSGSLGICCF